VGRLTVAVGLLAQDSQLLLGEDFLPWMVLAFGAAVVVGNLVALVRPPAPEPDRPATTGSRARPAYGRAAVMIVIGLIAAVWGAASLLA
jgi:hypothetical protein